MSKVKQDLVGALEMLIERAKEAEEYLYLMETHGTLSYERDRAARVRRRLCPALKQAREARSQASFKSRPGRDTALPHSRPGRGTA